MQDGGTAHNPEYPLAFLWKIRHAYLIQPVFAGICIMVTDQRTGLRSIRAAKETFAAVALVGLTVATILRCIEGRPGAFAGVILTGMALAVLSRFRVSWDAESIICQTPFSLRRRLWTEISAYSVEPEPRSVDGFDLRRARGGFSFFEPCRLRLHGRERDLTIDLKPYSWQDIRHLQDRVNTDIPLREGAEILVS